MLNELNLSELKAGNSLNLSEKETFDICGKIVCGYLNHKGGFFDFVISPIDNEKEFIENFEQNLSTCIVPSALFSIRVEQDSDQNSSRLCIEVPFGKDVPYSFNNKIFIEKDQIILEADRDHILDMVLRKQIEPERCERRYSTGLKDEDLSELACKRLFTSKRVQNLYKNNEPDTLIHALEFLSLSSYGKITNAGDILLAKNPPTRHPQTRVRAVCYKNKSDSEYLDYKSFEGPLVEVLEAVYDFIERNTPTIARFSEDTNTREELPLYPARAVREGLVNAFAHRDYSSFSGGIKIEVSANSLQIWNSGSLPEGVDVSTLEQEGYVSILRNPDIAHILYLQGYMEKLGRGSTVIRNECKKAGLLVPAWKSDKSGVTLTFTSPSNMLEKIINQIKVEAGPEAKPEAKPEAGPEAKLLNYCRENIEISNLIKVITGVLSRKEIQDKLNFKDSESFRKNYLKPALEKGLISMTLPDKPTSPAQRYYLTDLGELLKKYV